MVKYIATLEEEAECRKRCIEKLKDLNMYGNPAYAMVYGFITKDGRKRALKTKPVFFNQANFDRYIKESKHILLAVYNNNVMPEF